MQLFNGNIEETTLRALLKEGPLSTAELLARTKRTHACTKQGFYRSLRKLKSEDKIVVHKSNVSINNFWLRHLRDAVAGTTFTSSLVGDFSKLEREESLSLAIRGLSAMDRLWSHIFAMIEQTVSPTHPLFLYNPHNWSALLRPSIDRAHEESLFVSGRAAFLTIGSKSPLDAEATREIAFSHLQFAFNPRIASAHYLAVIDDFLIVVRFSKETRDFIAGVFSGETTASAARTKLRAFDARARSTIAIERDAAKSHIWKRRLAKDFYVPEKFRDF